jgi:hypothetical protein
MGGTVPHRRTAGFVWHVPAPGWPFDGGQEASGTRSRIRTRPSSLPADVEAPVEPILCQTRRRLFAGEQTSRSRSRKRLPRRVAEPAGSEKGVRRPHLDRSAPPSSGPVWTSAKHGRQWSAADRNRRYGLIRDAPTPSPMVRPCPPTGGSRTGGYETAQGRLPPRQPTSWSSAPASVRRLPDRGAPGSVALSEIKAAPWPKVQGRHRWLAWPVTEPLRRLGIRCVPGTLAADGGAGRLVAKQADTGSA